MPLVRPRLARGVLNEHALSLNGWELAYFPSHFTPMARASHEFASPRLGGYTSTVVFPCRPEPARG
jgi:hypothetical protein